VLSQVKQAFGSPFLDANARDAFISKCFIICPHEISQLTLAIIKEELHEMGERVTIIDGPQLFTLLQEYYPDYKPAEFEFAANRLATMRESVRNDQPLERLAFGSLQTEAARDAHLLYVKPSFEMIVRHWAVNSRLLLANLIPSLPEGIRARGLERKKGTLDTTSFYTIPPDHATRLAESTQECLRRIAVFTRNDLLAEALVTRVTSAFDDLITLISLATSQSTTRDILSSLRATYGERLLLPARAFLIVSHKDVLKLAEQTQALRNALDAVVTHIDAELNKRISADTTFSSDNITKVMHLSDLFHFSPSPYVVETQVQRIPVPEKSLYNSGHALFIVGPAGYGKTSFCRWHTLEDDKLFSQRVHNCVAVYVPLHKLTAAQVLSLSSTIRRHAALTRDAFGRKSDTRAVSYRVYLDGLDEVDDEADRSRIVAHIKRRKQLDAPTSYILTARDYLVSAETEGIPRVYLCPLSDVQIGELARLWLKDASKTADFLQQLDQSAPLKDLARIPLLCTLTILIYRRTATLPENRLKLYETFIELLCSGWDLAKGLQRRSRLKAEFKILVLRKVAFLTHLARRKAFRQKELNQVVSELDLRISADGVDILLDELTADGVIHRSGEEFEFRHLSLQEYLAALEIFSDPSKQSANGCLVSFLEGDQWWRDVVEFYVLLIRNPVAAVRWIVAQMKASKLNDSTAVGNCDHLKRLVRQGFSGL
jgi:hypothetical protein